MPRNIIFIGKERGARAEQIFLLTLASTLIILNYLCENSSFKHVLNCNSAIYAYKNVTAAHFQRVLKKGPVSLDCFRL